MIAAYIEDTGKPPVYTYLITLLERYTRDIQVMPGDIVAGDNDYESSEDCWEDYNDGQAEVVLGAVEAENESAALVKGAGKWCYNPMKLNVYELARGQRKLRF